MRETKIHRFIYIPKLNTKKEKYWRKYKVVRVLIYHPYMMYIERPKIIYVLENSMYLTEIYPGNLKVDIENWSAGGYAGEDKPEHFFEILDRCYTINGLLKPPRDIEDVYYNAFTVKDCIENDIIIGEENVLETYNEYKEKTK